MGRTGTSTGKHLRPRGSVPKASISQQPDSSKPPAKERDSRRGLQHRHQGVRGRPVHERPEDDGVAENTAGKRRVADLTM